MQGRRRCCQTARWPSSTNRRGGGGEGAVWYHMVSHHITDMWWSQARLSPLRTLRWLTCLPALHPRPASLYFFSDPTLQVLGVVQAHDSVVTYLPSHLAPPPTFTSHFAHTSLSLPHFRSWAWCRRMTTSSRPSPSTPTAACCSARRGTAYCGCGTRPYLAVRAQAQVQTARQALCRPSWVCSRGSQG